MSPNSTPHTRVIRKEEMTETEGRADWFTGTVHVKMLFSPEAPSRVSGGLVTFDAGARTAWHSHPYGQALIVVSGRGRVQEWGGPVQQIGAGDVVWFPAGAKHWHGASAGEAMSHIAITEAQDGTASEWMEKVSDAQYKA